jgi:hypothetical protein
MLMGLDSARKALFGMVLFIDCVVAACVYSLYHGQDANWDLRNYHFYVPFALLNGRAELDVAPAQLQSYSNPALDLPFYFLATRLNDHPKIISMLLAIPTAVAVFFLLLTLMRMFAASHERQVSVLFSLLMGVCGAAGISQWGTTMNEWPVAAIDMIALYVLVRALDKDGIGAIHAAASGFLCGIATGLKLTAATACAAMFAALFFPRGTPFDRMRRAVTFGVASLVGFMISAGTWMWGLYDAFGSPLFPYFNGIFQSPWWESREILPHAFGPRTWGQALLYPFEMLHMNSLSSEPDLRDWHLPLLYAAGILFLVKRAWVTLRRPSTVDRIAESQAVLTDIERLLLAYAAFFYLLWLGLHSIYRYLIQLELISGCVFLILCRQLVARARLAPVLIAVLMTVWLTKWNPSWGRVDFGPRFFDVHIPRLSRDALVLLGSGEPMAYLIPFFPPGTRFVGIDNNIIRPGVRTLLNKRVLDVLNAHKGDLYVIDLAVKERLAVLGSYGLRVDDSSCRQISSNMDPGGISLCPVVRVRSDVEPR